LHALDGIVFVDLQEKRIVLLSGSLGTRVVFGYGVIGHVEQGGSTGNYARSSFAAGLENQRGKKSTSTDDL